MDARMNAWSFVCFSLGDRSEGWMEVAWAKLIVGWVYLHYIFYG